MQVSYKFSFWSPLYDAGRTNVFLSASLNALTDGDVGILDWPSPFYKDRLLKVLQGGRR
jgi:hypothetical protein